ncbi:MAG: DEAD/DEAH box helicase [Parachlamydiales bacterium]|nr:DEAD/DEAH box helicase [Parachlamydiales bacterium]
MLNFRKLKQDFSSSILKEGKDLFDQKKIVSAKILKLNSDTIKLGGEVCGSYENSYECELEIDRFESQMLHSNCDCSYRYDCQHLAALVFYLEQNIDAILVEYSKQADIHEDEEIEETEKKELLETFKKAYSKEEAKKDANYQKQVLHEYITSSSVLSSSPFFLPEEMKKESKAELALIFNPASVIKNKKKIDIQLALRLPSRSKPLHISNIEDFLEKIRFEEPMMISERRYYFTHHSFDEIGKGIMKVLIDRTEYLLNDHQEKSGRIAHIDRDTFGLLLAYVYEHMHNRHEQFFSEETLTMPLPCLFSGSIENPLYFSHKRAKIHFNLSYIQPPSSKILLQPAIEINDKRIQVGEANLVNCLKPGMIYEDVYYPFAEGIKRVHLNSLEDIATMAIPKPLFGTFIEHGLPELKRYADVANEEEIEQFITLPYTGDLKARCELSYLEGELEALIYFIYEGIEIPAGFSLLKYENIETFVTDAGIVARNLVEEKELIEELFADFIFNSTTGTYLAKSEKKIVEFMTEVIPRFQERVQFDCPQNLLDQFIYDQTTFELALDYQNKVGYYSVALKVEGDLKGISLDMLWDCVTSKRSFIELPGRKKTAEKRFSKILVLDLVNITRIVQIFDELGIHKLDTHHEDRPLWSLVNIDSSLFEALPITFSMTQKVQNLRRQMLGEESLSPTPMPKEILAEARPYQKEGIYWLERLRKMYLSGILADDMGLGKTLQAIVAITQNLQENSEALSLVVCPTSLLYNWEEEINKFNPHLKVVIIEGTPVQRKKLLGQLKKYHVVITSYTLMQKDVDLYKKYAFSYAILDEAQHIKNRGTRNAKSVKEIHAAHRLILTGTPIENSLEELWSLFDYLMPGFLSTFERYSEKYIRSSGETHIKNMQYLRKKVSPFILRRMKSDVLSDLPAVSEITYYCKLGDVQLDLYNSYAASARDELVKLVEKEGFEKVQIHILATLTRLKQICCHPAIFAKEKPEEGDSAKYEMLIELLQSLVEGEHKTVVFSQYTRMLQIMRTDLQKMGIRFSYLDGTTKNRLQIVKDFNENPEISVFLVSLKAGGTGLNIVGADTVIHYDMWWNPAVENQATDRVHRIGQKKRVSAYKLVTKNSIEEKILKLQERKKGLVKKIVSCDDEAIAKLTWEDVLELLQT